MDYHIPVMPGKCLAALNVEPDKLYFDGTLGGGGHSEAILAKGGTVVGTDLDKEALAECSRRLSKYGERFKALHGNYKDAKTLLRGAGIEKIDGAIIDMGVSSHQIDADYRGFSFRSDGELDMRMDTDSALTAREIVNSFSEERLSDILFTFGEEKFSKRIAKNIVLSRKNAEIVSTVQLAAIVKSSVPFDPKARSLRRTFQALRIYVNDELGGLKEGVEDLFSLISSGGRLCIVTFHSLEDRVVKQTFKLLCSDCVCDKSLPVCVCGHRASGRPIGKYTPDDTETAANPRIASATLRVIEKL